MTYPNLQGTALIDGAVTAAPPDTLLPTSESRIVETTSGPILLPLAGYVQLHDGSYIATSAVVAGHILIGELEVPARRPSVHRNDTYVLYEPSTRLPVRATVVTASATPRAVSSFVPTVYPTLDGLNTNDCVCVEVLEPLCPDALAIPVTTVIS